MKNQIKFKKAKTAADIKNDPRVDEFTSELDGIEGKSFWLYLKSDFISPDMECHTIHEKTIKSICEKLNRVVPADQWKPFGGR